MIKMDCDELQRLFGRRVAVTVQGEYAVFLNDKPKADAPEPEVAEGRLAMILDDGIVLDGCNSPGFVRERQQNGALRRESFGHGKAYFPYDLRESTSLYSIRVRTVSVAPAEAEH